MVSVASLASFFASILKKNGERWSCSLDRRFCTTPLLEKTRQRRRALLDLDGT